MKITLFPSLLLLLTSTALAAPLEKRSTDYPGANELASQYPNSITGVYNASYFLLNFPSSTVAAILPSGTDLLPYSVVVASLPNQPIDTHPVIVKIGMDVDVSQGSMAPSAAHFDFHNSHVGIPFVDKSGDGATGFIYDIWLGSSNPDSIALTLIWAQMVATYATFTPDDQPFQSSGVANHFTASAIGAVQSTPVYELEYAEISSTAQGLSTVLPSQINTIANQGQFQQGLCTFDVQDWSFGATPHIIQATSLTLYEPYVPSSIAGTYTNIYGVRVPQGGFIETVSQPCI